jgi:hypothetical protein
VLGAALARYRGGLARWPTATLLALWPALGGHFVELFFLNVLRPRLPDARVVQAAARVGVWFVAGAGLALGAVLTARALGELRPAPFLVLRTCAIGGAAFIGIELVAHLMLQLRGARASSTGAGSTEVFDPPVRRSFRHFSFPSIAFANRASCSWWCLSFGSSSMHRLIVSIAFCTSPRW